MNTDMAAHDINEASEPWVHKINLRRKYTGVTPVPLEKKTENTKKSISILIVDNQEIVHQGLHGMLDPEQDIEIVGEAACPKEALALAELYSPDIILMDTETVEDDGIEVIRILKEKHPYTKLIMFILHEKHLAQALKAGATGYLSKDIKRYELVNALRTIGKGKLQISSLNREHLTEFVGLLKNNQLDLSERELTILRLISKGITTREISKELCVSDTAVKRNVQHIFNKLVVRNRTEAIAQAFKRKII